MGRNGMSKNDGNLTQNGNPKESECEMGELILGLCTKRSGRTPTINRTVGDASIEPRKKGKDR